MKKIASFAAFSLLILFLTKVANQIPPQPPPGTSFSLKAQRVIQCSPHQITLVDSHNATIQLEKDASWPDCSTFESGSAMDFYLSRGERTHFLSDEKTAWWRKAM